MKTICSYSGIIGILILCTFYGIRATYIDKVNYEGNDSEIKKRLDFIYHFIFHFVGSALGWFLLYVLGEKLLLTNIDISKLQAFDFFLLLFGFLGITGHIPQTLYGFVLSFGKIAESITKKIT